jgi:hypothetical protein
MSSNLFHEIQKYKNILSNLNSAMKNSAQIHLQIENGLRQVFVKEKNNKMEAAFTNLVSDLLKTEEANDKLRKLD